MAWQVATAKANEASLADDLLQSVRQRVRPETATMDKGYDIGPVYDACEQADVPPIIPLRKTPAVARGEHKPPACEHGEWKYAGADFKRKLTKWRCPSGECKPASVWRKASRLHPLVPTRSGGAIYTGVARPLSAPSAA